MKIGIDISQLAFEGSGIATYTRKLIENLLKIDKENEYLFFYSSLRKKLSPSFIKLISSKLNSRVKIKKYRFPPLLLEFLWNKLHVLPIEKLIGSIDIFHSSDWLQPPTQAKKVTTVHDLIVYKYPETFQVRGGHDIVANQKKRLKWVKKEVDLILVDAVSTKKDLLRILKVPAQKIKVIPLAVEERFKPQGEKEIKRVKEKYQLQDDYLLSVGAREARKNLRGVIRARTFLRPLYSHFQLIIAGGNIPRLKVQAQDKYLGFVPLEDLPALYSGAQCFVHPSFYEGFGLPVLEAMACACPVVTSNKGSLAEVAGQAAVLVDPVQPKEIAQGIEKAIENREKWVKKGFQQVKKFSWQKTAQETLAAYQEVLNGY